ncbi:20185_t:CDS:1 [Rhizophagus irregularis]|nr:20185_t:CDS:1 [Rhizophagus irregularis]
MPDEKWGLFFDVTCPLEIPMEDFDENWWPLVSNIWMQWNSYKQANGNVRKDFACHLTKHRESSSRQKENVSIEKRRITKTRPSKLCHAKIRVLWLISLEIVRIERYKDSPNHTHTVLDSDRIKRSQAVRILVENEAVKNYSPPAITVAVREYATELGLGTSVSELKRKEVSNIKYKVRGPMESHLFCNSDLKSDISESISFLIEKGYHVENYHVSHRSTKSTKSTKGIVFAHPTQLEKLRSHGWLTLIDSTHKTNKYDWRLFTLYVRDH